MTVNKNPPHENFLRTPLSYVYLLLPTFPFPLKSFCPLEAGNPGHLSLPLPHVLYKLVWNYLELITALWSGAKRHCSHASFIYACALY